VRTYWLLHTKRGVVPANPQLEKLWYEVAVRLGVDDAPTRVSSVKPRISNKQASARLRDMHTESNIESHVIIRIRTDGSNRAVNVGL
jgi:hypothetical protein